MKMPVVEKLLPGTGEPRRIASPNKTRKRLLPMQGEPLQLFEKLPVDDRALRHSCVPAGVFDVYDAAAVTL
jgi:hypothetical protein